MKRWLVLLPLLALLLAPTALALDQGEILEEQTQALGLDQLEEAGEAYTGQAEIGEDLDVGQSFRHMARQGKEALGEVVKTSVRSCVLLLGVTLLCGLAESIRPGEGDRLGVVSLAGTLAIAAVAVGDVHSLLGQGEAAMSNMQTLGDVLLPTVSMATAASGAPAMAAVKHGITILFSDLLLHLIQNLLIPLCYAYVAASVAWAALGNDGLRRIAGLLKWLVTILLSGVLLAFLAYLNLSGVISGGADAATVKAAKFTISNLVPVVGGVISDTAETLLAGASVLRNAAGVFGMLAVLGICVVPFLNLGAHYLMYKCTAALAATASGDGRVTGLIEALGTAFGLILAMTAFLACVGISSAMLSSVKALLLAEREGRIYEGGGKSPETAISAVLTDAEVSAYVRNVASLQAAEKAANAAKKAISELQSRMAAWMEENGVDSLRVEGGHVRLKKSYVRTSVDAARLKAEMPDVYGRFLKESTVAASASFVQDNE